VTIAATPDRTGTPEYVIRIVGWLAAGRATPLDGRFVVSYDPSLIVYSGEYDAGLETTDVLEDALRLSSVREALDLIRRESGYSYPQDRPLTAFAVEIRPASMIDGTDADLEAEVER
jgi:hypothetical protein